MSKISRPPGRQRAIRGNITGIDLDDIRLQIRRGKISLALACLLFLPTAFLFFQSRGLYLSAICVPGKIIDLQQQKFQKEISNYPVFSFVDEAGVAHTIHSRFGYSSGGLSLSHQYQIGDAVEVIYPNGDPEAARLKDFWSMWAWPIVFGSAGALLMVFGIVSWGGALLALKMAAQPEVER